MDIVKHSIFSHTKLTISKRACLQEFAPASGNRGVVEEIFLYGIYNNRSNSRREKSQLALSILTEVNSVGHSEGELQKQKRNEEFEDLASIFAPFSIPQRRLGRRQAGDRNAERAATDVIQADLVAELDRVGIAAVFAADADFQVLSLTAAFVNAGFHQAAHSVSIDGLDRILCNKI